MNDKAREEKKNLDSSLLVQIWKVQLNVIESYENHIYLSEIVEMWLLQIQVGQMHFLFFNAL